MTTKKTRKTHLNSMIQFTTQLWAMAGDALDAIAAAMFSMADDLAAFSVDSIEPEKIMVNVVDGIAIIPIAGGLEKDHGWIGYFSGREFSGYLGVREKVEKALLMPDVKAILFKVDSPGGTVDGCKECADFLSAASGKKPIYTYVDGNMMSAAYWLGCVGKVIGAPETAQVGSIGVRTLHADWSEYDRRSGIKYTHITAGKYKAIPNSDEPLSADGLAYVQERLDQTYSIFVNAVAKNRGIPPEAVTALEAKVLLAGPAVEAGLIDRIESDINTFIDYIKSEEETLMDKATLKANHSALYNEVMADGAAAEKANQDAAVKTAVEAAVTSALGVVSAIAGAETGKKIESLVKSGVSADQIEAMKGALGVQAPSQDDSQPSNAQNQILNALKAATPPPAGGNGRQVENEDLDFDALVDEHMAKAGVTKSKAMSAMAAKFPKVHDAWLKSKQKN